MGLAAGFLLVILAIGVLGEQFIGVGDPGFDGEYLGGSVAGMAGNAAIAGNAVRETAAGGRAGIFAPLPDELAVLRSTAPELAAGLSAVSAAGQGAVGVKLREAGVYDEIDAIRARRLPDAKEIDEINGLLELRTKQILEGDAELRSAVMKEADHRRDLTQIQSRLTKAERQEAEGDCWGIIGAVIVIVQIMEQFIGFGPPYEGDEIYVAAGEAAATSGRLGAALPGGDWRGLAAWAYSDQNAEQVDRLHDMAALDRRLAACIKGQADVVAHVQCGFGILDVLLAAAYYYELQMLLSPDGVVVAKLYAGIGAGVALGVAVGMLGYLIGRSVQQGNRAEDLKRGYQALAATLA